MLGQVLKGRPAPSYQQGGHMDPYIFYYKFNSEIFGVIEEIENKLKVESLQNRKTYDIDKNWIEDKYDEGDLEFSKNGTFLDFD